MKTENNIEDNTQPCHGCGKRWWDCRHEWRDMGDSCCAECDHRQDATTPKRSLVEMYGELPF